MSRFERQLPIFGEDGQNRIMEATVGIAGCGGLGVNVITQLAMAGVSRFILSDPQLPEMTNLNRQFIYYAGDLRAKATICAEWILALNPYADVESHAEAFSEETKYMFKNCDVIVDCLDSMAPRMVMSDLSEELNIPLVHAGVTGFNGQIAVCIPGKTKSLREMIGTVEGSEDDHTAIGAAVSTLASMEALEVLKIISGIGSQAQGKLITVDMRTWSVEGIDF